MILLFVIAGAACTASSDENGAEPSSTAGSNPPSSTPGPDASTEPSPSTTPEVPMSPGTPITITIGDEVLDGRLWANPTASDLASLLPLTLEFRDLNDVEKIAVLPRALTIDGVPEGDDPEPLDIGYYAPSQDLVFYYDDVGYYAGIVRIGVFDSDMDTIRSQQEPFTATVALA